MTFSTQKQLPDWQLERFALGELPDDEMKAVREALAGEPELRARMAELERSDAAILTEYPAEAMAARLKARLAQQESASSPQVSPARRPLLWGTLGLAAALTVAVLVPLRPGIDPLDDPAADRTRVKGLAPQLIVYRKVPAADVEQLQPGSLAHDHDLVQLAYQAVGRRYGAIVSIDGRGVVTQHLPSSGSEAAPLQPGAPVPLPQAYELDDAPGFERFYLVTSDAPFPLESVVAAVRQRHTPSAPAGGARLDLPHGMDQAAFLLRKDPR